MNIVADWFGASYSQLHPEIRKLHDQGGMLSGAVDIAVGSGLAGLIGKRLARKLGIPPAGAGQQLDVEIHCDATGLHWNRCFNHASVMQSVFKPHGQHPQGYWLEDTGPIRMALAVDIIAEGWHWRCLEIRVYGIRVPLFMMPRSTAYKTYKNGRYVFHVGITLPLIGFVLSYTGQLQVRPN